MVATLKAEDATLTTKGHTQLNSSVTSTSEVLAATPKAVKTAMDRADAAFTSANNGKIAVANAVTAKGVAASPSDTFPTLATKIGQISTGKSWASGVAKSNNSNGDLVVSGVPFVIKSVFIFERYGTGGWGTIEIDGEIAQYKRNSTGSSFVVAISGNGFSCPTNGYNLDHRWIAFG